MNFRSSIKTLLRLYFDFTSTLLGTETFGSRDNTELRYNCDNYYNNFYYNYDYNNYNEELTDYYVNYCARTTTTTESLLRERR